jgi:hypothetical protein
MYNNNNNVETGEAKPNFPNLQSRYSTNSQLIPKLEITTSPPTLQILSIILRRRRFGLAYSAWKPAPEFCLYYCYTILTQPSNALYCVHSNLSTFCVLSVVDKTASSPVLYSDRNGWISVYNTLTHNVTDICNILTLLLLNYGGFWSFTKVQYSK